MRRPLQGALTALVTPFDAQGEVDYVALTRNVHKQIEHGIDGLVPCGTTGETATLSIAEQEKVVRTVIEAGAGRVPVVAGTGTNATKETVERTLRAKSWGADAALVVCPYYNKPTQEGLFRHFKAVWEESGMPIVAYNVPGRTACDLNADTIGRLAELGAIVAVKDATADLARCAETLAAIGDRSVSLLSGDDFTILPFVATGGRGVISVVSNIAPRDTARLVTETVANNWAVARPLNQRIIALSRALFLVSNPIPIKAAMALGGWCAPTLRLPLVEAEAAITTKIKVAMNRYRGTSDETSLDGFLS